MLMVLVGQQAEMHRKVVAATIFCDLLCACEQVKDIIHFQWCAYFFIFIMCKSSRIGTHTAISHANKTE